MDPISVEEAQAMQTILEPVFGVQVYRWVIRYASYEALGDLIVARGPCPRARHLVPYPQGFATPYRWAHKQVRQDMLRYFGTVEGRQALIRVREAARAMRKRFEEARFAGY